MPLSALGVERGKALESNQVGARSDRHFQTRPERFTDGALQYSVRQSDTLKNSCGIIEPFLFQTHFAGNIRSTITKPAWKRCEAGIPGCHTQGIHIRSRPAHQPREIQCRSPADQYDDRRMLSRCKLVPEPPKAFPYGFGIGEHHPTSRLGRNVPPSSTCPSRLSRTVRSPGSG